MNLIVRVLFLLIFIVCPSLAWAQSDTFIPRSKIVRDRSFRWLNSENSRFQSSVDSLDYLRALSGADTTKYESLEEAVMDINDLLNKLEKDDTVLKGKNEGLSIRIGSMISRNREKAQVADDIYTEMLKNNETTINDFIDLRERFENRPTYYVNDVLVGQDMLSRIKESYILNREIRMTNTLSGNPNGEIWIDITPSAAERLKLDEYVYNKDLDKPLDSSLRKVSDWERPGLKQIADEKSKSETSGSELRKKEQSGKINTETKEVKPKENKPKKESKKLEERRLEENNDSTQKRSVRRVKKNIQNKK